MTGSGGSGVGDAPVEVEATVLEVVEALARTRSSVARGGEPPDRERAGRAEEA